MLEKNKNNILMELDTLEDQILMAQKIIKHYDELKSELKKVMSEACELANADQLKWETPNGTKITFSKGHTATIEKQKAKEFDINTLKTFYPDIYESCMVEKETSVIVKNATSDTLRITL